MIDKSQPAYARRMRLSAGAIAAAVLLTGAALLAFKAAVGGASDPVVEVHVPVSDIIDNPQQLRLPANHNNSASNEYRSVVVRR